MSRFGILGSIPVDGKVFPAIAHGHMAAPALMRVDYRVFKKTNKEKGQLIGLKENYRKTNQGAFKRKEFIINERLTF